MTTQSEALKSVLVLGNGQLGLMLGKAAKKLEIPLSALSLADASAWIKAVPNPEKFLITFEQEHIDEALLKEMQDRHIMSFPTWSNFSLLKSKLSQKEFLLANGISTSPYLVASHWGKACDAFIATHSGAVLKAGKGGYDGNGVWLVDAQGNTRDGPAREVAAQLSEPYLEAKVNFDREVAAVVVRSVSGELSLYPTVRSIMRDGICFQVEYTREFAETAVAKNAGAIARKIAEQLKYVGVLAVECFVVGGEVLVNEIAPRVHNSGHFTIDVCAGSQFENHLRAGLGLPLERTEPSFKAALMTNLLWPENEHNFVTLFTKLTCGPEWPENVKMHWYGKTGARARRKMGHFTVYGDSLETCHAQAQQILASRWA